MQRIDSVNIGPVTIGQGRLALIGGPCVAESLDLCLRVAEHMAGVCRKLDIGYIFKASYDKANRTAVDNPRGPGLGSGLEWLAKGRETLGMPVLSDVHDVEQTRQAGAVLDCLQIPAFLCRQTDLLLAAGQTGKAVNIKKGQFVAPERMSFAVEKVLSTGNTRVLLCERGTCFGYDNLVTDFRGLPLMRQFCPVVFDATHSVQQPGSGKSTGGQRQFVPLLAKSAMAAGADALFLELHPNPDRAQSDAATQWPLHQAEELLKKCLDIFHVARE